MVRCANKLIVIGFAGAIAMVSCERINKEREFVQRGINGIIIRLTEDGRDECTLYIKESSTKKTLKYPLVIGRFVKENHIQAMDSISKKQNSGMVLFYRRTKGRYLKIAELHYY